jgi:hypothetical protein
MQVKENPEKMSQIETFGSNRTYLVEFRQKKFDEFHFEDWISNF